MSEKGLSGMTNFIPKNINIHTFSSTVIIRINAAAFIKFLLLKVRRMFEGGVYSRTALIPNIVKQL